jgi:magnesium-transporting ATPase (P-type)
METRIDRGKYAPALFPVFRCRPTCLDFFCGYFLLTSVLPFIAPSPAMKNNRFRDLPPKPYSRSSESILETLESTAQGLTSGETSRRLEAYGPNKLQVKAKDPWFIRFARHFNNTLILVLLGSVVITALLQHWVDSGVILGVVLINAIIGYIQEGKAEKALEGIRNMLSARARVLRNGNWTEIGADELVPGDIVGLRSGDRVPADLRMLEAQNLRIEESALTGESVPSDKSVETLPEDTDLADRSNMAFSGTLVTTGRGVGVVTATGSLTEIGMINTMIEEVETLETPLTRQMTAFGKMLSLLIVGFAVVMFGLAWLFHDYGLDTLFLAAIGFAVAAIPEGLPAIVTITFAIGVKRMADRRAITRHLSSVETLGSVTVVCSDKTGTLTRNEMTARYVVTPEATYEVSGEGYGPVGEIRNGGVEVAVSGERVLTGLIEVMEHCNDTRVEEVDGHWKVVGEPTEGALVVLARKAGESGSSPRRLASIPFESENKFMAVLVDGGDRGRRILLKGAPDRLLDRCPWQADGGGGRVGLDRAFWEESINALGDKGLRVLAAAVGEADPGKEDLALADFDSGMVFLGIVGILDPPRPEAIEAIQTCREAGIRVKMITGDHVGTALAIAREMRFGESLSGITGKEIEAATDAELENLVQENEIFARTSPEHKLRIVKALQARSEVVAMTGDGVNDAPALKRADIGIAMGIKGTEATKEAAEIVLADDNFASIERAIQEGRAIYDNLRKAIVFILPTSGAEAFVMLVAVIAGMSLPLTPVQILWVNMVTAVTLALALAFEPAEPDIMSRPPREPGGSIIDLPLLWRIGFVSLLAGGLTIATFIYGQRAGAGEDLARTIAVNTLVCTEAFYLFNCRFLRKSSLCLGSLFDNKIAWFAVAVLACLQLGFVYLPFMNTLFGSAPLQLSHWLIPLASGLVVFLAVEVEKAITS